MSTGQNWLTIKVGGCLSAQSGLSNVISPTLKIGVFISFIRGKVEAQRLGYDDSFN
jgi:hypothetical protein